MKEWKQNTNIARNEIWIEQWCLSNGIMIQILNSNTKITRTIENWNTKYKIKAIKGNSAGTEWKKERKYSKLGINRIIVDEQ